MEKRSQFVSVPDLCSRWPFYTPRGVQKLVKHRAFPRHFCTVSNGRVPIWILGDVLDWEKEHPEVYDEGAKMRKQKGFFRARSKGLEGLTTRMEAQP